MDPQLYEPTIRNVLASAYLYLLRSDDIHSRIMLPRDTCEKIVRVVANAKLRTDCVYHERNYFVCQLVWFEPGLHQFCTRFGVKFAVDSNSLEKNSIVLITTTTITDEMRAHTGMVLDRGVYSWDCSGQTISMAFNAPQRAFDNAIAICDNHWDIVRLITHVIASSHFTSKNMPNDYDARGHAFKLSYVIPGAANLSAKYYAKLRDKLNIIAERHSAEIKTTLACGVGYEIRPTLALMMKCSTEIATLPLKYKIKNKFKNTHPIYDEVSAQVTECGFDEDGFMQSFANLTIRGASFQQKKPAVATPTNPRDLYLEHYDGWRIGNPKLELLLWRYYVTEPFNAFPRDIMKIIVGLCLRNDAVCCLEKIFGIMLTSSELDI